jgi:hypothetical protein
LNKFIDPETGNFKDLKGYHESVYMANNYKTELNKKHGIAKQLEVSDRLSKIFNRIILGRYKVTVALDIIHA